jgi:hypothetical protein
MFYLGIQVEIGERKYHVAKCVSHRSQISLSQCNNSEDVNSLLHAMYAGKVSIIAIIYTVTSEYTLENDPFLVKFVRKVLLRNLT